MALVAAPGRRARASRPCGEADFQAGRRLHLPDRGRRADPPQPDSRRGRAVRSPLAAWQVALTALSGGSASRLFHAVREERGLAYSVSASPVLLGGQGFLSTYAGSTPARAPETLEVLLAELGRLPHGLSADEFVRARNGLRASVVFGAESLRARATGAHAGRGRLRAVRRVADLRGRLDGPDTGGRERLSGGLRSGMAGDHRHAGAGRSWPSRCSGRGQPVDDSRDPSPDPSA